MIGRMKFPATASAQNRNPDTPTEPSVPPQWKPFLEQQHQLVTVASQQSAHRALAVVDPHLRGNGMPVETGQRDAPLVRIERTIR